MREEILYKPTLQRFCQFGLTVGLPAIQRRQDRGSRANTDDQVLQRIDVHAQRDRDKGFGIFVRKEEVVETLVVNDTAHVHVTELREGRHVDFRQG